MILKLTLFYAIHAFSTTCSLRKNDLFEMAHVLNVDFCRGKLKPKVFKIEGQSIFYYSIYHKMFENRENKIFHFTQNKNHLLIYF